MNRVKDISSGNIMIHYHEILSNFVIIIVDTSLGGVPGGEEVASLYLHRPCHCGGLSYSCFAPEDFQK